MKIRSLTVYKENINEGNLLDNNEYTTVAPPPQSEASAKAPITTVVTPAASSHSTAVTALILLLALFFLCFFSVYARSLLAGLHRSSSSRRRRRGAPLASNPGRRRSGAQTGGLDRSVVSSLPILYYVGSDDEEEACVVCLAEFEFKEKVKVIPGCGHVFHPECIDEWLVSRGSCPVCRRVDVFGEFSGCSEARIGVQVRVEAEIGEEERKEEIVLERSSSCSWSPGEEVKVEVCLRRSCSL